MPVEFGVEPASPQTSLTPGATLTTNLPGRGHAQLRVEQISHRHVTLGGARIQEGTG
jgi:NADH dehydrogenase